MRKKLFAVLLGILAVIMLAGVLCACEEPQELQDPPQLQHEHVFSEEWSYDVQEHWRDCSTDGCDGITDKGLHDFDVQILKEPTCTEESIALLVCKVCGYEERTTYGLAPHDFVVIKDVKPTCEETGEYCRVCKECGFYEDTIISSLGHDITVVSAKQATCTEGGWTEYVKCSRCDHNTFTEIRPLGHLLSYVKAKEPTCTQSGWKDYEFCSRCDHTTYEELPALGHDIMHVEAKDPTCTQSGWEEYDYCKACDYTTGINFKDPLGHELADHDCTRCDKSLYDSYLYGYDYLGTLPDGSNRQALYDLIAQEAEKFHKNTSVDVEADSVLGSFDFATLGITDMEAVSVWKTFKDDNPIYYWMSNGVYVSDTAIEPLIGNDYRLGETRKYYNKLIDDAVMSIAEQVYYGASDYDTALCYHDSITLGINYVYDEEGYPESALWAHNIIGVLEKTGAVCEGYARTFQLLLNYSDVENLFVTGVSGDVGHAWNLVRLDDGNWYWCDLTFDDTGTAGTGTAYTYFCAVDDDFVESHTYDTVAGADVHFLYDLPERADKPYVTDGVAIGDIFSSENMSFVVVGYNAVSLLRIDDVADAEIPESIEYEGRVMKVVALGMDGASSVFSRNAKVRTVYIPSSVRMIWDFALLSKTLERIDVSPENQVYTSVDGVLYTKNMYTLIAFPSAAKVEKFIVPDDTHCIAHSAFSSCKYLSGITFGKNVSTAGVVNWGNGYPVQESFMNVISGEISRIYKALQGDKEFVINPENTHYVTDDAGIYNYSMTVLYCIYNTSIKSFHVSATLKSFAGESSIDDLFENCRLLEVFTVDPSNSYFSESGGVLYNKDQTKIISVPKAIKGEVVIADGVTEIGMWAFSDCTGITQITLPYGLKKIGDSAFKNCTSLVSITVPQGVEYIGVQAFYNCTSLRNVTLREGLVTIATGAFTKCSSLEEITLPASLKNLGKQTFLKCDALERVVFSDPVGWECIVFNNGKYERKPLSSSDIGNATTARNYLMSDYINCEWQKA